MLYLDLLWKNARPGENRDAWLVRQVLGERLTSTPRVQILSAVLRPIDDLEAQDLPHNAARYLNRWTAARSDLLTEHVLGLESESLPPSRDAQNRPTGDVLQWLFESVACLDVPADRSTAGDLLRAMKQIRFPGEPLLDALHRGRYLVFRFFWDAVYHEL
jgi:hypothetical protein